MRVGCTRVHVLKYLHQSVQLRHVARKAFIQFYCVAFVAAVAGGVVVFLFQIFILTIASGQ